MASQRELDIALMSCAFEFSKLSKAKRLQVGAVAAKNGRIIATGYNGTPSGYDNQCEEEVDGELVTRREVLHAESNCLSELLKSGVSSIGVTIYLTASPCFECAKLLAQSGVIEVVYSELYRDSTPLSFLEKLGVLCRKI